ncbi:MAG: efflux RND transporter permease subunit [Minicystis sp.]
MCADRRAVAAVIVMTLGLAACGRRGDATLAAPAAKATSRPSETALSTVTLAPEAEARLGIEVAAVERQSLPASISAPGEVTVPTGGSVVLVAPFAARVSVETEGTPRPGASVTRGQVLVKLSPLAPPDRDVRAQAERGVAAAAAQVEAIDARVQRLEKLLAEGGSSERQIEEARAERIVRRAELSAATKRLETIQRAPLEADVSIPLRAPRDGLVRSVSVAPGQLVSAGAPLFEILGAPALWVRAAVFAGEAARVAPEAPAHVATLGAGAGAPVTALPVPAPPSAESDRGDGGSLLRAAPGHAPAARRARGRDARDQRAGGRARRARVGGALRRRRGHVDLRAHGRARLRAAPRRSGPHGRRSRGARARPGRGRAGRAHGRLRAVRRRVRGREVMRALVSLCLHRRFAILGLALVLLVAGVQRVRRIPVDVFPEFAPPRVEVQTEAPGLSSLEVEQLVTDPIERALEGVPFAQTLRSKSVSGLSSVVILFGSGADVLQVRQLVQERLSRVGSQLPAVALPPVLMPPLSSTSRIMKIGLTSETKDQMALTDLAKWVVRPRLLAVPGVANVAIWGERPRQLQVVVDPARLRAAGVRLDEVLQATRDAVVPASGGFVDTPQQRLGLTLHPGAVTAADLAGAAVPRPRAASIPLGEIAAVREGSPPAIGDAVINDRPGLLLIVEKQPWGNTLEVTRSVEAALEALRPGLPGVEVDPAIFRPASFVERALGNLGEALLVGCVLVVVVLGAFLYDLRTAFISVVAIPASLVAAAATMNAVLGTIDTMTLAGLAVALGEVVDDAIIDVENVLRRLDLERRSPAPRSPLTVVLEASLEVRSAVVHATAIVILVFLPVFFLDGLAGSFFRPLAGAYVLSILASLVIALTVTPAMCLLLLPRMAGRHRESPVARAVRDAVMPMVGWVLARPRAALGATVASLLVAGAAVPLLGESFLPDFRESDFLMHWVAKPGTSLEELQRTSIRASKELQSLPGVHHLGAHLGRAEAADEVVGVNFAELWIGVDPKADLDRTTAAVQRVVDGYPGLQRDVQTYLHERMKEVLSGGSGSIVVRIQGHELDLLRDEADRVARELKTIAGATNVKVEPQVLVPQIDVRLRPAALARAGVSAADVGRVLRTVLQGSRVGEVESGGMLREVVVVGEPRLRADVAALRDLVVVSAGGTESRLGELAEIAVGNTPNTVQHEGGQRRIDVSCDAAGVDLGTVARRVQERIAAVPMAPGHHAEVLGEHAARTEARARLSLLAAAALLGIFLVLHLEFQTIRLTLLVFATLPLALLGGVIAVLLTGGVVSLGALVGFVTVLGIAARNGVMLVSHLRHLEREEGVPFGVESDPARRARAPHAHRHDRAGHRPRPRAARRLRHAARPGAGAAHGGGHPRGAGQLDAAQPARGAVRVPAARRGADGRRDEGVGRPAEAPPARRLCLRRRSSLVGVDPIAWCRR